MSKIVLEKAEIKSGKPSYYLLFEEVEGQAAKRETVYCSPVKIDGYWLIRVSKPQSGKFKPILIPDQDRVIGVTSDKEIIPEKILNSAREYAKSRLTDQDTYSKYTELEDRALPNI